MSGSSLSSQELLFDSLCFTPTPTQMKTARALALSLRPSWISDWSEEILGTKAESGTYPNNRRHVLPKERDRAFWAFYRSQLDALATFSRSLFIFENTVRNILGYELESHYKNKKWWYAIERDFRAGQLGRAYTGFTSDQLSAVTNAIWKIDGDGSDRVRLSGSRLATCSDGFAFLSMLELGPLYKIAEAYWGAFFAQYFDSRRNSGLKFSRGNFKDQFLLIIRARNQAYHHNIPDNAEQAIATTKRLLKFLAVDPDAIAATS